MPRYQQAQTFDIVRSVKNAQSDIRSLQVQSAGKVRQNLNQSTAALNTNPYFWGGDDTGWEPTNGTFSVASDPPSSAPFPYAGLYTNNGVTVGYASESDDLFVAQPFQQYQVSGWVNASSTSVTIGLNWFDSGLGALTGPADTAFTVTAGTWTQLDTILRAPVNTAFACPQVGPTAADGSTVYFAAFTVVPVCPLSEDWHSLGNYPSGTTTRGRYRLTGDGELEIDINLTGTPTSGANSFPNTMPAAYRPAVTKRLIIVQGGTLGICTINTTGVVGLSIGAGGSATADVNGRVALD